MFALYTARFLEDASIVRGMKVLDVGTGAGDVALLLADLVGPEGSVIGSIPIPSSSRRPERALPRPAWATSRSSRRRGVSRARTGPRCGRRPLRAVLRSRAGSTGPPHDSAALAWAQRCLCRRAKRAITECCRPPPPPPPPLPPLPFLPSGWRRRGAITQPSLSLGAVATIHLRAQRTLTPAASAAAAASAPQPQPDRARDGLSDSAPR